MDHWPQLYRRYQLDVEVILFKLKNTFLKQKKVILKLKHVSMPEYWFHFTQCCCSRSYLIFSKGTFLEDEEVPLLKLEKYLFEPKKGTFLNQKGTFFRPKVPFSLILLLKKVPVRDLFPGWKMMFHFFSKYTLKERLFFCSFY